MTKKAYTFIIGCLFIIPTTIMVWKSIKLNVQYDDFLPQQLHEITYQFYVHPKDDNAITVKSYLPTNNVRQKISKVEIQSDDFYFTEQLNTNKQGVWRADNLNKLNTIEYRFLFKGKSIQYTIAENLPVFETNRPQEFLVEDDLIESNHPQIVQLAKTLSINKQDLKSVLTAFYEYCYNIPSIATSNVTGALTTLNSNKASCNGKSRLFVALCRSVGIAARTKGGLILETTNKKTSHLWAEVWVQNQWIPFDTLNGHFAFLPANYLEIYAGDLPLTSRSKNVDFNYQYKIKEIGKNTYVNAFYNTNFSKIISPVWTLIEKNIITYNLLKLFLLFPLCALVVAVFKNVLGIKTFGTFLSVLIAFSFASAGYFVGLLLFITTIALIGFVSYILDVWGILYTPKLTIILTITILWMLFCVIIGAYLNIEALTHFTFFPFIVLALTSQQFTKQIIENGYVDSLKILGQTLAVTTVCFFVISSNAIASFLIIFPESTFIVLGIMLLLGKWIGLRLSEYKRFEFLIS